MDWWLVAVVNERHQYCAFATARALFSGHVAMLSHPRQAPKSNKKSSEPEASLLQRSRPCPPFRTGPSLPGLGALRAKRVVGCVRDSEMGVSHYPTADSSGRCFWQGPWSCIPLPPPCAVLLFFGNYRGDVANLGPVPSTPTSLPSTHHGHHSIFFSNHGTSRYLMGLVILCLTLSTRNRIWPRSLARQQCSYLTSLLVLVPQYSTTWWLAAPASPMLNETPCRATLFLSRGLGFHFPTARLLP